MPLRRTGWPHTGDIGLIDGKGSIRIVDRLKDMCLVGGFNAYRMVPGPPVQLPGSRSVRCIDTIPANASGKILKSELRRRAQLADDGDAALRSE